MYYKNPAVQAEIRRRAYEGHVAITDHARQREEARDIEDVEILKCLKQGCLEGEDWNPSHQETTYRMVINQGISVALVVIVALDETNDIVVTVFRRDRR